jgi:hypothetical protein
MQGWCPGADSNDGRKLIRSIYFDDRTTAVYVVAALIVPRFHRINPL